MPNEKYRLLELYKTRYAVKGSQPSAKPRVPILLANATSLWGLRLQNGEYKTPQFVRARRTV
jgi:hypothetical protein